MNVPDPAAAAGRGFLIGAFAVAAVVGLVVGYLGITGHLGVPIPGTSP